MKIITVSDSQNPEDSSIELVERKGLGHPDTLADAMAESISIEYSKLTRLRFGAILHHNVDKLGIHGGKYKRDFGYKQVEKPVTVVLGGRMSTSFGNEEIDIFELQEKVAVDYLRKVLPNFEADKNTQFNRLTSNYSLNERWYKPLSLDDLPEIKNPWANDTSVVVSHAPLTTTESLTKAIEGAFYTKPYTPKYDFIGQDIKVMCIRNGKTIDITVCIPFIAEKTPNREFYNEKCEEIRLELLELAEKLCSKEFKINLQINTNDKNKFRSTVYMTGTGSCIEFGEEGFVGRGNSAQGIISTFRPHSMEAPFGKNPVYHTGRVHSYFSSEIAKELFNKLGIRNSTIIKTNNGDRLFSPDQVIVISPDKIEFEKVKPVVEEILETRNHVEAILDGYLLPISW